MAGNKHDIEPPPPVGYERTDVDVWAIGKFAIALALICVAALGMLLMFFHYMIAQEGPPPPKAYSDLANAGVRHPPAPQLEETPIVDLQRERAAEDQILTTYGWVDKQQGIVRVPIDAAIDQLVRKGLPSRSVAVSVSDASVPSESGLGPIVQQSGGPLAGGPK